MPIARASSPELRLPDHPYEDQLIQSGGGIEDLRNPAAAEAAYLAQIIHDSTERAPLRAAPPESLQEREIEEIDEDNCCFSLLTRVWQAVIGAFSSLISWVQSCFAPSPAESANTFVQRGEIATTQDLEIAEPPEGYYQFNHSLPRDQTNGALYSFISRFTNELTSADYSEGNLPEILEASYRTPFADQEQEDHGLAAHLQTIEIPRLNEDSNFSRQLPMLELHATRNSKHITLAFTEGDETNQMLSMCICIDARRRGFPVYYLFDAMDGSIQKYTSQEQLIFDWNEEAAAFSYELQVRIPR